MSYSSLSSITGARGERRARKAARRIKRRSSGVLSTAERRAASRSTARRARKPGTSEYRLARQRRRKQPSLGGLIRRQRVPSYSPERALSTLTRLELAPGLPNPALTRPQRQLYSTIVRKHGTAPELRAKVERRMEQRERSGAERLLAHGLVGEISPEIAAAGREVTYGTRNPSALQIGLAAPLPFVKGGQLLYRGARAASGAQRTVGAATRARAVTSAATRAGARAPQGVRAAAARFAERAPRTARAARGTGRAARGTAKGAAKATAFPIRHPLKTTKYSVLAQTPAAVATGDPSQLTAPFEGQGVVADIAGTLGEAASSIAPGEVAGNLVKDILELPANTPPAIYMPIAGVVEAAQGDPSRLEALWDDYTEVGLIPAVLSGDKDRILNAIKEHPLYAGLEASGVRAVAGRGAGIAARSGALGPRAKRAGATGGRQSLRLPGALESVPRRYSPDLIEKGFQVRADIKRRRRTGGQHAYTRETGPLFRKGEATRLVRERTHRLASTLAGTQRMGREQQLAGAAEAMPRRKIDREGVRFATERIIRSPQTFLDDLTSYGTRLDRVATRMQRRIDQTPTRRERRIQQGQLRQNRATRQIVEQLKREGDPDAIFASARANAAALNPQTAALEEIGLLGEGQGAQAAARSFAITHMGAKVATPKGGGQARLVDRDGNPLPHEQVVAEMRRQRVDPEAGAFVSQRPGARGPGSFWRPPVPEAPSLPRAKRTGKATRRGTFETGYETIREQRARNQQVIDAVRNFRRIVSELAVSRERFETRGKAADAIRDPASYGLPTNMKLTAVRLAPHSAGKRERGKAEEAFDKLDPEDTMAVESLADDLVNRLQGDGPGPWAVVPEAAWNDLRELFRAPSTGQRAAQLVSQTFKGSVLPLSPNWYLSNFLDINMRAALEGTSPYGMNARLGRRYLRDLEKVDPQAAAELRAGITPGMTFGRAMRDEYHRTAEQFQGSGLETFARAFAGVRRAPVLRSIFDGWRAFREGAYRFEDWFVESRGQEALLGKALREEIRDTKGNWRSGWRVTDKALREFIGEGKVGTPAQIALGKRVERAMGQWTANSPAARRWLVDYAPFGQWLRASAKFVYATLPRHHPVKLAIGAAVMEMTQEQREELGLSYFAEEPLPDNLMGSIPTEGGGLLPIQSLTTFGQFAAPFSSAGIGGFVLPYFPLNELQGIDWAGNKLVHEDGTPLSQAERAGVVGLSMLEAFVPGAGQASRATGFDPLDTGKEAQGLTGLLPRAVRPYDVGLVDWLRSLEGSRQINVPVTEAAKARLGESSSSSSSSSAPVGSVGDQIVQQALGSSSTGGVTGDDIVQRALGGG